MCLQKHRPFSQAPISHCVRDQTNTRSGSVPKWPIKGGETSAIYHIKPATYYSWGKQRPKLLLVFLVMPQESYLSESIREVVFVVANHGVPTIHQQPQPCPLSRPDGKMSFDQTRAITLQGHSRKQHMCESADVWRTLLQHCTLWSLFSRPQFLHTVQHMHWHCQPMLVRDHIQRTVRAHSFY